MPASFNKPVFLPLKWLHELLLVRCSPGPSFHYLFSIFLQLIHQPNCKSAKEKTSVFNDYASLWLCYHNFLREQQLPCVWLICL